MKQSKKGVRSMRKVKGAIRALGMFFSSTITGVHAASSSTADQEKENNNTKETAQTTSRIGEFYKKK